MTPSYFVIGSDGHRYGPADPNMLRQWVLEGRVDYNTVLEDATTAQRIPATSIAGLFPSPPPNTGAPFQGGGAPLESGFQPGQQFGNQYQHPPVPGQYPRAQYYDETSQAMTLAWVFFGIGCVMCALAPIFCGLGLWQANQALAKGNINARTPRTCNLVVLCLGCLLWAFYAVVLVLAFATGFNNG